MLVSGGTRHVGERDERNSTHLSWCFFVCPCSVFIFVDYNHHTAKLPITSGTHTNGARWRGHNPLAVHRVREDFQPEGEGTGISYRHGAGSCNSWVPTGSKASAIDATSKTFFEHLYLVLGLSPFEPRVNCPCAPTPRPQFNWQLFLDLCAIFPPDWPRGTVIVFSLTYMRVG